MFLGHCYVINPAVCFWECKNNYASETEDKEEAETSSVFCTVQQLRLKKCLWQTHHQTAAINHSRECKPATSLTSVSCVLPSAQHLQGGKQHYSEGYGCAQVTGYLSGLKKKIPFLPLEMRSCQSSPTTQLPLNER